MSKIIDHYIIVNNILVCFISFINCFFQISSPISLKIFFYIYLTAVLISIKKNPAYGRQRISRPMWIVGPIQFWRRLAFLHMFLSRNCSRWTSSSRRPTGFATHTFIKKLQQMDELFEKADWLCYTCFHQEIAADGRALWGGRLLRANERPPKNRMKRDKQTNRHADIATLWKNRPRADSLKSEKETKPNSLKKIMVLVSLYTIMIL